MNRDSLDQMRFDRRLLNRRGWVRAAEKTRALESLPDVSHKATTLGTAIDERGESDRSETGEPSATGA